MKNAIYIIATCVVGCPHCGLTVSSPSAELFWTEADLKAHGPFLHCNQCGLQSRMVQASNSKPRKIKIPC